MRKIFYIFFATSIVFSCGSDSDSTTLNEDLVGSWSGITVDNSSLTSTEIDLTLDDMGEGYVLFDKENLVAGEITNSNWDLTWSSTSTSITLNYYDYDLEEGEQLIDSETDAYEFIDNDTAQIIEDDGDVTLLNRYWSI